MAESPKIVQAPCSECVRKTKHEVLFETSQQDEETLETYVMMSCGGCSTVSMGRQRRWLEDGSVDHTYYPSPVSRKMPTWMFLWSLGLGKGKGDAAIGAVMMEVYQAVDGGQYRLAAMGIRALLEQVMIQKVGDLKTFDMKLDEFQKQGYISAIQRDAMRATLDVGDAAMHRAFLPTEKDLTLALDIVEGVLAPIYDHRTEAEKMADRVPPRPPRPKG
jgi:Domain of unknown function (DUF4145)